LKYFFLSDTLLQHVWITHIQTRHQLQEYQNLIEKIKLTPRTWNTTVNLNTHLLYLSTRLGISINLIKFKQTLNYNKNLNCTHKNEKCFIPYYKYQNPNIRLCQNHCENFFQINILEFKSKYYTISSVSCKPILIQPNNINPENINPNIKIHISNLKFEYKSETVTMHDINAILKNQKIIEKKSFSIALYSTSSYVKSCHTKIITDSNIGYLENESDDILHLFLTPHLHGPTFDVHILDNFPSTNRIVFNQKNNLSNTHITEGKYIFKTNSNPNKELLNQNFCICEHPDTERYYAPNNKSFKPLGTTKKI